MYYVEGDVKVKGYRRVTGKYRGSAYSDCNIKVKSQNSYRIPQHRELWLTSYYAKPIQIWF